MTNLLAQLNTINARLSKIQSTLIKNFLLRQPDFNTAWAQPIVNEFEQSKTDLLELADKHRDDTDSIALEAALRQFFFSRWVSIRNTPAAYVEYPEYPLNKACEELAIAIAKEFTVSEENDEGEDVEITRHEPTAQILMPSLRVTVYSPTRWESSLSGLTENPDRTLATHKFVVNRTGEGIIPLQEWLNQCHGETNEHYPNQLYSVNPQGEYVPVHPDKFHQVFNHKREAYIAQHPQAKDDEIEAYMNEEAAAYYRSFTPVPMTDEDLQLLDSIAPPASKELINDIIKHIGPYKRDSFIGAVNKLIKDLRDCGHSSTVYPWPDVVHRNESFVNPIFFELATPFFRDHWDTLPPRIRKKMSDLRYSSYPVLNSPVSTLFYRIKYSIQVPRTYEERQEKASIPPNFPFCVEVLSNHLSSIVSTHSDLFGGRPRVPHAPLIESITQSLLKGKNQFCGARYQNESVDHFNTRMATRNAVVKALQDKQTDNYVVLRLFFEISPPETFSVLAMNSQRLKNGSSMLSQARSGLHIPLAIALIRHGASANEVEVTLRWALVNNHPGVIDACLERADLYASQNIESGHSTFNSIFNFLNQGMSAFIQSLVPVETVLHVATAYGHSEALKKILAKHRQSLNLNQRSMQGTALQIAAKANNFDCMQILIEQGAHFSGHYGYSRLPIHALAMLARNQPLLCALVKQGMPLENIEGLNGQDLLSFALINNYSDLFHACLARDDLDIDRMNSAGKTVLQIAAEHGALDYMVELVEYGADITGTYGFPPMPLLEFAIFHEHEKLIATLLRNYLLNIEQEFDTRDHHGVLIDLAIHQNWPEVVKSCLSRKEIDVNDKGRRFRNPLQLAVFLGRIQIISLLLSAKGINLEARDAYGKTPLQIAFIKQDIVAMVTLIQHGANSTLPTGSGSLLDWALTHKHPNLIRLLVPYSEMRVEILIHSIKMYYQLSSQQAEVYRVDAWNAVIQACLKTESLNLNQLDRKLRPPLFYALEYNRSDLARGMIERGAEISLVPTPRGIPFLHWVIEKQDATLVEFLLKRESPSFEQLRARADLHMIYRFLGHRLLCALYQIAPNSNLAFKLYTQAFYTEKRSQGYRVTEQKMGALTQGLAETDKTFSNSLMIIGLKLFTDRRTEAGPLQEMPEPLRTRFFN